MSTTSRPYNDPIVIMKVAKAHAFILARTFFIIILGVTLTFSILVIDGVPPIHVWIACLALGFTIAGLAYWYVYWDKALSVIHLSLEADHVEETKGVTAGDYRVVRTTPTPEPR
jgi:protein-S-isoprenylcysteine O-methyltransferase Ste14